MRKILTLIVALGVISAQAAVVEEQIKKCETGEGSPSMCIELHKEIFSKGEMPTLRDNVPMRCFVSKMPVIPDGRYYDSVTRDLGKVFTATFHVKKISVTMANQIKEKTVGYIIYDGLDYGGITSNEGLASTRVSWRPRQNQDYQGEVQFNRDASLDDGSGHSYVYDWTTDYKGHLLLKQLYFENYFFELNRELRCVEIK